MGRGDLIFPPITPRFRSTLVPIIPLLRFSLVSSSRESRVHHWAMGKPVEEAVRWTLIDNLQSRELRVWSNRQIPCSILKLPLSNEAKGKPFLVILNFICLRIKKVIYMSVMTSPVASLWNRGLGRLGKGLFLISINISLYKLLKTLFHSRTLPYLHLHVISLYFSHSVNPIRVSISYSTPCGLKCCNRLSCFNWWRHVVSQCSQRFVLVKTNAICCC